MTIPFLRRALPVLLLGVGCTSPLASLREDSAWFRVDELPGESYRNSDRVFPLGPDTPRCAALTDDLGPGDHPIYVFVHGWGGANREWQPVFPALAETHPVAMFMYRWDPTGVRNFIESRFAAGISRLAECFGPKAGPIIVIAHSAGGIMVSFAQKRIVFPTGPHPRVYIMTVAAPLTLMAPYPHAAKGVDIVHLRTSYPADSHMKPDNGQLPNDPAFGVPGAPQIDLPDTLDHDDALLYVAQKVANGTWLNWFGDRSEPAL